MGSRILSILFQASPGLMCWLCLERMLNGKNEKIARKQRAVLWMAAWLMIAGIRILSYSAKTNTVVQILFITTCGLILKYGYEDRMWKKWAAFLTMLVAIIFADMCYTVVLVIFTGDTYISMDFSKMDMMMGTLIVALAGMTMALAACERWCRVQKKGRNLGNLVLFMAFAIAESTPLLLLCNQKEFNYEKVPVKYLVLLAAVMAAAIILVLILFNRSEKDEIESELQEVRRVSELEKRHYQEIERRREEMAKIRHDYNNVLSSAQYLLDAGRTEEAREMIGELAERIEGTEEGENNDFARKSGNKNDDFARN